jgi:hypothetical protein
VPVGDVPTEIDGLVLPGLAVLLLVSQVLLRFDLKAGLMLAPSGWRKLSGEDEIPARNQLQRLRMIRK